MPGVYPYDAAENAAISRLRVSYNGGTYDASTNPYGFGQGGHTINFIPALQDVATAAQATSAAADSAASSASAASASATAAATSAANLQGTSTTSNSVGTGVKSFTTQAGKSFSAGTYVTIYSAANPTVNAMGGQVASYSGTALTVNVTAIGSGVGNTATDWVIAVGGAPGQQGTTGLQGPQGATPALQMTFSTATSNSDPGNGIVKFDNATIASITRVYIDNVDASGASITSMLDAWDDSTNTALRGTLWIRQLSDSTKWLKLDITGAVTDSTGYRAIVVANGVGGTLPDNNATLGIVFSRTGDRGADGAGAGDMLSDVSVSVAGRLVTYADTGGKHTTSAPVGIGTAGAAIGRLDTANTWSGAQALAALLDLQQDIRLSGGLTPAQITADQNDYAPPNHGTANSLRLSSDATRNITGLQGGAAGRILLLDNVGSNNIVLKDASASSTAANRFDFGADVTLGPKQGVLLQYDNTLSRWRLRHPIIAGTSGHVVGYLDQANTYSAAQSFAGNVDIQQAVFRSGDITPAQITINLNDYNPTGLATASVLRLSTDASRNLTGLQGGADGRELDIHNVGSNPLVLQDENASSSAANRFAFGADVTLLPKASLSLWYDATSSRWRQKSSGDPSISAATIASSGTTDLGASPAQSITISGTTTITAFGSSAPTGAVKYVQFSGALTLTHNATSLILPDGVNITTVAGDTMTVRHEGSGNWRVLQYSPNGAWQSWTPTWGSTSGSGLVMGAVVAQYQRRGKTVHFSVEGNITTNGTSGTFLTFTLPFNNGTPAGSGFGRVFFSGLAATAAKGLTGFVNSGAATVFLKDVNGAYPGANGEQILCAGTFQAP